MRREVSATSPAALLSGIA